MNAVTETSLPGLKLIARGKVRDIYAYEDKLLFIATDRISAFDVVLPQPIPDKGKVLHQVSSYWFDWAKDLVPNYLLATRVSEMPDDLSQHADVLSGRSALIKKADMFPVECVARGYIVGSGWKEYKRDGTVCGIRLPEGLRESDELAEPIFTPATKAETGHDENISFDRMVEIVGGAAAEKLRDLTLEIYGRARKAAAEKGVIIADTKFEFGRLDGEIVLCDEVLTPDSSRFWPKESYEPGRSQPSYDKQFVRDYLETLDWDKNPPGPDLPNEVVDGTRARYIELLEILTGKSLEA